jgi:hypothetical protein
LNRAGLAWINDGTHVVFRLVLIVRRARTRCRRSLAACDWRCRSARRADCVVFLIVRLSIAVCRSCRAERTLANATLAAATTAATAAVSQSIGAFGVGLDRPSLPHDGCGRRRDHGVVVSIVIIDVAFAADDERRRMR